MAIASATIAPMTTQKLPGLSKNGSLKFMPMTPARTIAGRATAETRVSVFMTSFDRWALRPR